MDTQTTERLEKHVAISEAVDYMDVVISTARALHARITGAEEVDPSNKSAEIAASDSLSGVLLRTPDRTREKCDIIIGTIQEITDTLF